MINKNTNIAFTITLATTVFLNQVPLTPSFKRRLRRMSPNQVSRMAFLCSKWFLAEIMAMTRGICLRWEWERCASLKGLEKQNRATITAPMAARKIAFDENTGVRDKRLTSISDIVFDAKSLIIFVSCRNGNVGSGSRPRGLWMDNVRINKYISANTKHK